MEKEKGREKWMKPGKKEGWGGREREAQWQKWAGKEGERKREEERERERIPVSLFCFGLIL